MPPDSASILKEYVSSGQYPENLYAAYSFSIAHADDPVLRTTCTNAADHNLGLIESRNPKRFDQGVALNTVLTLGLCSQVKDEQTYLKVLDVLFDRDAVGRYGRFQNDVERIIVSNNFSHDNLIERLTKSLDVINRIVGIRLAEIKGYSLDTVYLGEQLLHDDAYVRLAAAKYVTQNKEKYAGLYNILSQNTNRRVRDLVRR